MHRLTPCLLRWKCMRILKPTACNSLRVSALTRLDPHCKSLQRQQQPPRPRDIWRPDSNLQGGAGLRKPARTPTAAVRCRTTNGLSVVVVSCRGLYCPIDTAIISYPTRSRPEKVPMQRYSDLLYANSANAGYLSESGNSGRRMALARLSRDDAMAAICKIKDFCG